jgi:hypothetical protein
MTAAQVASMHNTRRRTTVNERMEKSEGGDVSMSDWRTAPVNGAWRLENADYHGHKLSVYRGTAARGYRAYVDGRVIGIWRTMEIAMAVAALAPGSRKPPASLRKPGVEIVPLQKIKA